MCRNRDRFIYPMILLSVFRLMASQHKLFGLYALFLYILNVYQFVGYGIDNQTSSCMNF